MNNIINRKNNISKKRNFNGGFTLVELLATIAVLSLISVIVIFTAVNVIDSAKNKSYMVTINEIESEANTYVLENNKDIFWLNGGNNKLYQCITVQNLIDMGYFNNNILDSKVSEDRNVKVSDYIYIEKDQTTETITRQVLLYDNNSQLNSLCGEHVSVDGVIEYSVPEGWARSKEVTITYKLNASVGSLSNYKYSYSFDAQTDSSKDISEETFSFNNRSEIVKKITVNDEGWIYAKIDKIDGSNVNSGTKYIEGIDTKGPIISLDKLDKTVRGSVIIPFTISDTGSGVDGNSIELSDFKISIGNNILKDNYSLENVSSNLNTYNYNLKIDNYNYEGEVIIVIDNNQILDKLGNGNGEVSLNTGVVFSNKYMIDYQSNGGTGSMSSTSCTYDSDCTISANTFTRTGYTFLGWSISSSSDTITYDDKYKFSPFTEKSDITLYAIWGAHTYNISYTLKNGTLGSSSSTSGTYDKTITISNPTKIVKITGNANGTGATVGSATSKAQTFSGWTSSTINTSTAYYGSTLWSNGSTKTTSTTFKNLTPVNGGSVTLVANWTPVSFNLPTLSKTGYTCEWNTKSDGSGTSYNSGDSYTPSEDSASSITMYAVCKTNTYTIKYNANGGAGSMSNTSCTYESDCTISANAFTRSGYTFNGWNTKSDGSGTSYTNSQKVKNLTSTNGDVVDLYAMWKVNYVVTCSLKLTSANVITLAETLDFAEYITYQGFNSNYEGDSVTSKTISAAGTYTYYIKTDDNSTGQCSIVVSNTEENYSCPENYTLSGSKCSSTHSYYASKSYSCTCYKYVNGVSTYCTSSSSYSDSNSCQIYCNNWCGGGSSFNTSYSCGSGYTKYPLASGGYGCQKTSTTNRITTYTCPSGYTKANDSYCWK